MQQMFEPEEFFTFTKGLSKAQLENLEAAILWRWNDIYAAKLSSAGYWATAVLAGEHTQYVLVRHDSDLEAEWATPQECQILLDTVANLSPEEAWQRWVWKKEPRADQTCFDLSDAKSAGNEMVAQAFNAPFLEDVTTARCASNDLITSTVDLINARKAAQKEFLQLVEEKGLEAIQQDWVSTLTELKLKYKFSRAHIRDAIAWALKNRDLLLPG